MTQGADPPCIYCGQADPEKFTKPEHVVAQAFGTFGSKTPVLRCVCDECNAFFGRALDLPHARDTFEGVTRYQTGIRSKETRVQKRLTIALADGPEAGDWAFAQLEGVDGVTGTLMPIKTQLLIINQKTNLPERYFEADVPTLTLPDEIYGKRGTRRWFVLAMSKDEHAAFVAKLQAAGIDFRPGDPLPTPYFADAGTANEDGVLVTVEGEVDDIHKRALAKTLMNVAAYVFGGEEVRGGAWDATRRFVRYGEGKMRTRISADPFWFGETAENRAPNDSINIAFQNARFGLVGAIEYYNRLTYSLILAVDHTVDEMGARFTRGKEPLILPIRSPSRSWAQFLVHVARSLVRCARRRDPKRK